MKRLLLLSTACITLFLASSAQAAPIPAATGHVNDHAQVLPAPARQQLENLFRQIEQKTSIEIAILTVATLEGEPIDDFAVQVFQKWGIGKKGKDNGLLILAAIKDRKARIEVGYGLEGMIPDGLAGRILRDAIFPEFKQGRYDQGLMQGAAVIAGIIGKDKNIEFSDAPQRVQRGQGQAKPIGPLAWIIRIILFIGAAILFIKNPFLFLLLMSGGRGGGGGFGRGSGFGGFGGGLSGGGGASGSW